MTSTSRTRTIASLKYSVETRARISCLSFYRHSLVSTRPIEVNIEVFGMARKFLGHNHCSTITINKGGSMKKYWWCGFILSVLAPMSIAAESYLSLQTGLATSHSDVDVDVYGINHPTYCDVVLYPNPVDAPTEGACALSEYQRSWAGLYRPAGGWFTNLAYGRVLGSWRIEGMYERNQFSSDQQLLPLATSGDSAILSKTNEWSQYALPNNSYDDQSTSILAVNVLREFETAPSGVWDTWYIGAGVGVAFLDFNYGNEFLRKTVGEGYLDVPFPVQWPDAAKLNAAGSLSSINTTVQERALTYSLIAGVDMFTGTDLTFGFRLTWRVVGDVEHDNALWRTIRSHAPVIADGRTPFETDFVFRSGSYLTIGLVATLQIGGNKK